MQRRFFLTLAAVMMLASTAWAQIDSERVLKTGRNALYFEDYVVAIGYFNQVVAVRPWQAEPYFYRSIAKLSLEDYVGAASDATLALERNAFIAKAYLARGIARQNIKDYEGAEEDYRRGLYLSPNDEGMGLNLTNLLLYRKEYAAADTAVRQFLSFYPKNKFARLMLSDALMGQEDTTAAILQIDTVLAADSAFAPAYSRLAMLANEREDYKEGVRLLDRAISADSDEISYYINRGIMRYQLEDLEGAVADYTHVIDKEPTNKVARFNRALINAFVGNRNRAIEDFDFVISKEPDNMSAVYNRALLLSQTGQYRRAIEDYNRVLAEYPQFVVGYWARSEARRAIGDLKGADRDYWYAYDLDRALIKGGKKPQPPQTKTTEKETRSESDENIEKYGLLLVAEPREPEKAVYESRVRGRVQDRHVTVEPLRQYVLTYYAKIEKDLPDQVAFSTEVEKYNYRRILPARLILTNKEGGLTVEHLEEHKRDINRLDSMARRQGDLSADNNFRLALSLFVLSDFERAIVEVGRAIHKSPDFTLAYFLRSAALSKQMEADRSAMADSKTTEPPARRPAGKGTIVPAEQLTQGLETSIKRQPNNYQSALADLNRVIELSPDFAYAYYNRALLYASVGSTDLARKDYDRAIELAPTFASAYYNRGLLKLSVGLSQEGIADLSMAGQLGIVEAYNIIKRFNQE